jgi:hypothetical protein
MVLFSSKGGVDARQAGASRDVPVAWQSNPASTGIDDARPSIEGTSKGCALPVIGEAIRETMKVKNVLFGVFTLGRFQAVYESD